MKALPSSCPHLPWDRARRDERVPRKRSEAWELCNGARSLGMDLGQRTPTERVYPIIELLGCLLFFLCLLLRNEGHGGNDDDVGWILIYRYRNFNARRMRGSTN